jgi:hypothetical protein
LGSISPKFMLSSGPSEWGRVRKCGRKSSQILGRTSHVSKT